MNQRFVLRGAAVAAGAGLVFSSVAACTVPTPAKAKTTFQMYANVDAEGHLGSNFDAVSAATSPGDANKDPIYVVTFAQPITHCAAAAQAGKAGGPDLPSFAEAIVIPPGTNPNQFLVAFRDTTQDAGFSREPFMLTVTCSK